MPQYHLVFLHGRKHKGGLIMWTILDRLKEPSTYAGLSVIALIFVTQAQWETISTAIAAVAGLISMILKERSK